MVGRAGVWEGVGWVQGFLCSEKTSSIGTKKVNLLENGFNAMFEQRPVAPPLDPKGMFSYMCHLSVTSEIRIKVCAVLSPPPLSPY